MFRCQQTITRDFRWSGLQFAVRKDLHFDDCADFDWPRMSGEKRKAADDWIEATIVDESGRRGAYLAAFSGVIPPTTTTFREFKRKRNDNQGPKDIILQGETERIEFEGRTNGKNSEDSCQYTPGVS
jgi:hypothetical protein